MQPKNLRWITLSLLIVTTLTLSGACRPQQNNYALLTTASPIAQIAEGLALSVNPTALATTRDFGVQLSAVPETTFADSKADAVWAKARQAVPASLQKLSPVFQIQTSGTLPPQMFLSVVTPAQTGGYVGLYAWDGQSWQYLAAHARGGQLIADVAKPPSALALFAMAPLASQTFVTVEPGEKLSPTAGVVDAVLLGGVGVQTDGSLTGQLPDTSTAQGFPMYAIVRNYDASGANPDLANRLLTDAVVRANHLAALTSFGTSGPYAGLVLDYRGIPFEQRAAYAEFVGSLAQQLHAQGKKLMIEIPLPAAQPDAALDRDRFVTGSYDWRALGSAADALLMPAALSPADFGSGAVETLLTWATGEVERNRLALLTSAASVDGANGVYTALAPAAALAPLGSVAANPATLTAGEAVTLTLSGKAQNLAYDAQAFASRYTYNDGTEHTVWLTSAATLSQRLALAAKYGLGGVVVTGLAAPGLPADMASALAQYKTNAAAQAQIQSQIVWTVRDASGTTVQATALPDLSYIYVAQAPGTYQFSAELQSGSPAALGSAEVSVAQASTPTPTPRATTAAVSSGSSGGTNTSGGTDPVAATPDTSTNTSAPAAPPPPITSGSFELGGQVPGYLGHVGEMKQAKMSWVKVQNDAGIIGPAHAAGFKVLVSVLGDKNRAADPNYWPEYAAGVASIASQGADAIEVWNEANIDREWPTGQISGATYTGLLKQAYAAIKAANPNTLVISGAPAPTGAEGAFPGAVMNDDNFLRQMADAGAANYMDCVGIHFNTGTTSPNATTGAALSGYHYSYYFWPMVNLYSDTFGGSRPLCFTELGFVSPQGYESIPLPGNFSWAAGITVANQAQWLAEAASLSASSGKVRLMIVFNVDFTQYLSNDPQAGYAILRPGGSCPACASLGAVMP